MEIKDRLLKPFTEEARSAFVLLNEYKLHYTLIDTDEALEAWAKTEEDYFEEAKEKKHNENTLKANRHLIKSFIVEVGEDNTPCEFIYNPKTESNLNSAALLILSGQAETKKWTDEQGITVFLRREDIVKIGRVFEVFADAVWAKWGDYKAEIDAAATIEEIESIIIDYEDIEVNGGEQ